MARGLVTFRLKVHIGGVVDGRVRRLRGSGRTSRIWPSSHRDMYIFLRFRRSVLQRVEAFSVGPAQNQHKTAKPAETSRDQHKTSTKQRNWRRHKRGGPSKWDHGPLCFSFPHFCQCSESFPVPVYYSIYISYFFIYSSISVLAQVLYDCTAPHFSAGHMPDHCWAPLA